MKRVGYLYDKIKDPNNIALAGLKACKRRRNKKSVQNYLKNKEIKDYEIYCLLDTHSYEVSPYEKFKVYEPKEREIFRLPFFPDRIIHHALMNVIEPELVKRFIDQTYSCIKGRGIHKLAKDLRKDLSKNFKEMKYCLIIDIKKFYPSIDKEVLKEQLRRVFKDDEVLELLNKIIDSSESGVPIGNYPSQFLANLNLTSLDHWIKEELKAKHYYAYCDDRRIFSDSKEYLRNILCAIKLYVKKVLKMEVKGNYSIVNVAKEGVYFIGYKFYPTHTLLSKNIKNRMFKLINKYLKNKIEKDSFLARMYSYSGWMKFCNSKNLLRKINSLTGFYFSNFNGKIIGIGKIKNKKIYLVDFDFYGRKGIRIDYIYKGNPYSSFTKSKYLLLDLIDLKLPCLIKIK